MSMCATVVAEKATEWYSEDRRAVSAAPRPPMGQRRIFTSMVIRLFPHRISTTTQMRMVSTPVTAVPLRQGTMPGHPRTPRPCLRATREHGFVLQDSSGGKTIVCRAATSADYAREV